MFRIFGYSFRGAKSKYYIPTVSEHSRLAKMNSQANIAMIAWKYHSAGQYVTKHKDG